MKFWRITIKGSLPLFTKDVLGKNLEEAIHNFVLHQEKIHSSVDATQIKKIELIGDTEK